MPPTWNIQTPTAGPGAVAVLQLRASDAAELDAALGRLGIKPAAVGGIVLRNLCGIDRGLVARWNDSSAWLMPHGGAAVIRALIESLLKAGIHEAADPDPRAIYPEAASQIEARMLAAVAHAASPLAIDPLLDQPQRWEEASESGRACHKLQRLIDPPLLVAIGPPNIGKSSLVNALAGRRVAIVLRVFLEGEAENLQGARDATIRQAGRAAEERQAACGHESTETDARQHLDPRRRNRDAAGAQQHRCRVGVAVPGAVEERDVSVHHPKLAVPVETHLIARAPMARAGTPHRDRCANRPDRCDACR